jgi:hypothetical protein
MNSKHFTGDAVDLMPVSADLNRTTGYLPELGAVQQPSDE